MKSLRRWAFVFGVVAALCLLTLESPRPASTQGKAGDGKKSDVNDARSRDAKGAKRMLDESGKGGRGEESILSADDDADAGEDPDLPPWIAGRIEKSTYLRMRADYIDLRRGRPHNLPFNPRERAIEKMKKQENDKRARSLMNTRFGLSAALAADPEWRPLGPYPIPNGQTSVVSVPVSGRTIAIAVQIGRASCRERV